MSGSNVALFLLLVFVASGPLAAGPVRRAVVGLAALPVYAAVTGFEPSVLRASLMAGIAFAGRLGGLVLEAWQVLSAAVVGLLILDPVLAGSVGLQLSAAATAGVLVGARWPVSGWLARSLAVSIGAQLAVAPLLIAHFGTVPLVSPLANLAAAPLVFAATLLAALGLAWGPLMVMAAFLAEQVLRLAHAVSTWPALGPVPLLAIAIGGFLVAKLPSLRGYIVLAGSVWLAMGILGGTLPLPAGSVVVLDVGQGDAILLSGGNGRFALVDGGPDAVVLADNLRQYGVDAVELTVLTHVHADHATGIAGLIGRVPLGLLWSATEPHETPASEAVFANAAEFGVLRQTPSVGTTYRLGALLVEVLAPRRRYASPNDQSIVLLVTGPERTMLLTGDVEKVAQSELTGMRADVLKVPHQGAATSDRDWLVSVGCELAVISVGPNDFGHPKQWVITALEEASAEVLRTDRDGDVVVDLSSP